MTTDSIPILHDAIAAFDDLSFAAATTACPAVAEAPIFPPARLDDPDELQRDRRRRRRRRRPRSGTGGDAASSGAGRRRRRRRRLRLEPERIPIAPRPVAAGCCFERLEPHVQFRRVDPAPAAPCAGARGAWFAARDGRRRRLAGRHHIAVTSAHGHARRAARAATGAAGPTAGCDVSVAIASGPEVRRDLQRHGDPRVLALVLRQMPRFRDEELRRASRAGGGTAGYPGTRRSASPSSSACRELLSLVVAASTSMRARRVRLALPARAARVGRYVMRRAPLISGGSTSL